MEKSVKSEQIDGLLNLDAMRDPSAEDAMQGKYLTFWTDGQLYGIAIADVVQIVSVQQITPVPDFPYYAKGIINLRGSIIPIIDVRLRFGKAEIPYNEKTCIIVTDLGGLYVGFVVDSVDEVTDIADENICEPPHLSAESRANEFLIGIGKLEGKIVMLLETKKILNSDELVRVTRQSAAS